VSNITLSMGEDVLAVLLTWMATWKPYIAAAIACVLAVIALLLMRWIMRALKALFRGARQEI
jgi:hypothetical protein